MNDSKIIMQKLLVDISEHLEGKDARMVLPVLASLLVSAGLSAECAEDELIIYTVATITEGYRQHAPNENSIIH